MRDKYVKYILDGEITSESTCAEMRRAQGLLPASEHLGLSTCNIDLIPTRCLVSRGIFPTKLMILHTLT